MKTYIVTEKVHGYLNMCIDAENKDEAIRKANMETQEGYFGDLENVEWELHNIYENKISGGKS